MLRILSLKFGGKSKKRRSLNSRNSSFLDACLSSSLWSLYCPLCFLRADDEGSFEDDEMLGGETAFLAAATAAAAKKRKTEQNEKKTKAASTSSPGRLRKQESQGNWADLFFVLDVMSGSIDVCEILVFISKTDPLVRQLEEKKVDPGKFLPECPFSLE